MLFCCSPTVLCRCSLSRVLLSVQLFVALDTDCRSSDCHYCAFVVEYLILNSKPKRELFTQIMRVAGARGGRFRLGGSNRSLLAPRVNARPLRQVRRLLGPWADHAGWLTSPINTGCGCEGRPISPPPDANTPPTACQQMNVVLSNGLRVSLCPAYCCMKVDIRRRVTSDGVSPQTGWRTSGPPANANDDKIRCI